MSKGVKKCQKTFKWSMCSAQKVYTFPRILTDILGT